MTIPTPSDPARALARPGASPSTAPAAAPAAQHRQLAVLFAAYPIETRNVPAADALATAQVYARALEDLDEAETDQAILALVRTSTRLPTVAAIRQEVLALRYGPPRPGLDAWGDVQRAMRKHGARHAPGKEFTFEDPLVANAVERLGWSELCRSENPAADHAHFAKLYEALRDQERARAVASPGMASRLLRPRAVPVGAVDVTPPRVSEHAYVSAGDDPYASGGIAYTGCTICGRSRSEHRAPGGGR